MIQLSYRDDLKTVELNDIQVKFRKDSDDDMDRNNIDGKSSTYLLRFGH